MIIVHKTRSAKFLLLFSFIILLAISSAICLSACGEIRYDYYVLTTSENSDGTLTVTACTVVKDKPVTIPAEYNGKKIKALGDGNKAVFGGCEFTTLIVEPGVEEIADNACLNWSPLTSLTLGEGLKRIGAYAFSGCTELKEIPVPTSVTSIGEGAFEDTAWYKSQPNGQIINVGSFLYEYKGNMSAGTEIKETDFKTGTKYISDYAFSGCLGLKKITLPQNLEKIGASAFSGCTSLESIVIPANVSEVGARAFEGCTALKNVTIPSGVGSIAPYMFFDCSGLTTVNVASGIVAIGDSAFENCVGLPSVDLPADVKSIGDNAFKNCYKLASVTAPSVENYGNGAFDHCIALSAAALSPNTKVIGDGAFNYCVKLTEIDLPTKVEKVGDSAFGNCFSLNKVTVERDATKPEVLTVGEDAFTNCFALSAVSTNDVVAWCGITFADTEANPLSQATKLYIGTEEMTELTLPATVSEIGAYAFVNTGLNKATFHKGLTKIGEGAFKGCLGLKENGVTVESVDSWCGVEFGDPEANPLYYGEKLYENATLVTKKTLTPAVKKIGAYAFYNCTALQEITIPSSVGEIGAHAFTGCAKLAKVTADFGEKPDDWDADWNDFCGTDVEGGTIISFVGEKQVKLDTNTIMAIVVGGILVVVASVLLIMWLIKKIKRKLRGATQQAAEPETAPAAEPETTPAEETTAEESTEQKEEE